MKAVVSLTERSDRNFEHTRICAERSLEEPDITAVEVVARGSGVEFFRDGSDWAGDVRGLLDRGVVCKVSQPCVTAREMTTIDGVRSVPSGAIELVRLQSEGYDLVKVP